MLEAGMRLTMQERKSAIAVFCRGCLTPLTYFHFSDNFMAEEKK